MSDVPFLDVGAGLAELRPELDEAYRSVLDRGMFVLGPELSAFEQEWAGFSGADHAVGVGCGFDALELGLRALGIGAGDEVLVPSHTYVATWLAVSAVGAVPVPVEPDETGTLDPERLDAAATPATAALLPVHLYGQPAAMGPLLEWARGRGVPVLVDAAQAHGARYLDAPIGALGDAVAWSFYPSKNLGALGDGGAVTTNDAELARRVRSLRNYGSTDRDRHDELGRNSRLDELQAALLRVKLTRLEEWNRRRAAVADRYLAELSGLALDLPVVAPQTSPAWHLFVVRVPADGRAALRKGLADKGISTMVHYPTPPARQPAYADDRDQQPIADRLAGEVLSLPIGPHLSQAQQDRVVQALHELVRPAQSR